MVGGLGEIGSLITAATAVIASELTLVTVQVATDIMAESVALAASALDITSFTIQSVQALLETIDSIKHAPTFVKDLVSDVEAIERVLRDIEPLLQAYSTNKLANEETVLIAMENCANICEALKEKLQDCMKHSHGGEVALADKLKVALFEKGSIKTLRGKLNHCKTTLVVALSANMM